MNFLRRIFHRREQKPLVVDAKEISEILPFDPGDLPLMDDKYKAYEKGHFSKLVTNEVTKAIRKYRGGLDYRHDYNDCDDFAIMAMAVCQGTGVVSYVTDNNIPHMANLVPELDNRKLVVNIYSIRAIGFKNDKHSDWQNKNQWLRAEPETLSKAEKARIFRWLL